MYFYVYNLQGDVTHILDASKNIVGTYEYDAWGQILNIDELTSIAKVNPFRYRGYYYDTESGLYYLNSRYYNPEWGRFINTDDVALLGVNGDFSSYNLFAYCGNNPIVRLDTGGDVWETVFDAITLTLSIIDVFQNPNDVLAWLGLAGDVLDLIPFVTGLGEAAKAVKITDKIVDSTKVVNKVDDVVDATSTVKKAGWKVGDDITNLTKAGNQPSWSAVRQRYWKNEAYYRPNSYSPCDLDLMKKGRAPIGDDGFPLELHHTNGRNGDNFFIFTPLTKTKHMNIHFGG